MTDRLEQQLPIDAVEVALDVDVEHPVIPPATDFGPLFSRHRRREIIFRRQFDCALSTLVGCPWVEYDGGFVGEGDGDMAPDWEIVETDIINLRAERAGGDDGRVYTISVTCTDTSGNDVTSSAEVLVPHG